MILKIANITTFNGGNKIFALCEDFMYQYRYSTTTTDYPAIKSGFFAQKNLDEAIERNMWDGSLTKLSFAIEKRLFDDQFIDDRSAAIQSVTHH